MNLKNATVRAKLFLAFGGLTFMVLLITGLSLRSLSEANARFEAYVNGISAQVAMANEVRDAVDRRAISARNLVLVTKPADLEEEKGLVTLAHQDVQTNLAQLNKLVEGNEVPQKVRDLVHEIDRIEHAYGPVALSIVNLALNQQRDEAIAKMNDECRPLLAALIKASTTYSEYNAALAQQLIADAHEQYLTQRNWLVVGSLTALLGAVVAGMLIVRSLTRALGAEPAELGQAAQKVAAGDLRPVVGTEGASAGSVLASLSAMQRSLADVVGQVREASDSIATGSAQIATGNADLSQRTEEQASNLQQTAASMEQLTSTVKNNADTARKASQLAAGASNAAARGGEGVQQVVASMQDIAASSKKISDIIGVIDGIAFQTNILALNAAVEAARAGEQGRGFAVVASEVRTLAQRSASAAKEIKTLIVSSVEQVELGAQQANQAGHSMGDIVAQVQHVSQLIEEISRATAEQTSGISQVGDAVNQLDQVTQQNAALVEESAAAAESLRRQGAGLAEVVRVFQLG